MPKKKKTFERNLFIDFYGKKKHFLPCPFPSKKILVKKKEKRIIPYFFSVCHI